MVGGAGSAQVQDPITGLWSTPAPEVYNPATGVWSAVAGMADGRRGHTATVLPDGEVLIAGGNESSQRLPSAEIYGPSTRRWRSAGTVSHAHGHTATLLKDGRVLLTGGEDEAIRDRHGASIAVASAVVYELLR